MNFGTKVTVRRSVFTVKKITRIEIGGPVGSGETALVEAIAPHSQALASRCLSLPTMW